jgi:hypothetical protein
MRETMPKSRRYGAAVRGQFDIHDANEAPELARVNRLHGARPDIYRGVGWRALVELASQATRGSARLELEARIIAGERVNGVEIIRARGIVAN